MKKNNKKNYQFGAGQKKVANNFLDSEVFQKYANAPFMMSHELAHKKVIDHFFPNDPAEIFTRNGRPMTANNWMKDGGLEKIKNDKIAFENYEKILIAGYVQEIIDLGLERYFDQILEAQMQNVQKCVALLSQFGEEMLWNGCYTNDDGKFYFICKRAGFGNDVFKRWKEAGHWCLNFLKAA